MVALFGVILLISSILAYHYQLFSESNREMANPSLIGAGIAIFLFYSIPILIFIFYHGFTAEITTPLVVVLQLISEVIKSFVLVVLAWFFLSNALDLKSIKKESMSGLIGWILCIPIVHLTVFLIKEGRQFFGIPYIPTEMQSAVSVLLQFLQDPLYFVVLLLTICVGAPFTEEIVFRGFIQGGLRRFTGRWGAVLISSMIFSFVHYDLRQGGANFELLGGLFILGLALGYIYEKRKNLWAPIVLHMTHNFVTALILWIKN